MNFCSTGTKFGQDLQQENGLDVRYPRATGDWRPLNLSDLWTSRRSVRKRRRGNRTLESNFRHDSNKAREYSFAFGRVSN
jgi:hypothetical protein